MLTIEIDTSNAASRDVREVEAECPCILHQLAKRIAATDPPKARVGHFTLTED